MLLLEPLHDVRNVVARLAQPLLRPRLGLLARLVDRQVRDVPAREKTIQGTVTYSPASTGFIVEFDDYMLETGRKEQNLYMLGKSINYKKDRLIIISR